MPGSQRAASLRGGSGESWRDRDTLGCGSQSQGQYKDCRCLEEELATWGRGRRGTDSQPTQCRNIQGQPLREALARTW